ncbi:ABC transporter permease [Rugosimonospora africana]|uniref:Exporter of polyketide antibiotics n=1 Tax=Rugosimonospora africana TaxID=556532 RepID=A0A8J3QT57_9ACTN|nr:ABC transporter permease [Rugosimonospora africana]GIH14481.1 exporter of polyketide antibiotics [Rugosimonospora africana]
MSALAGTGTLTRLALRRDRILIPVWVAGLTLVMVASASSVDSLYPTLESRRQLAAGLANDSSVLAIYGPANALDTTGGMTMWKPGGLVFVLIGLMSLLIVVRHSRAEEESGRLELVGSGVVGRHAPLTAALLTAAIADVAVAALVALGMIGVGAPAAGSIAAGLSFAACGLVFAAIAAIAAQVTEGARAANGLAGTVLGLSYLLRAGGDSAGSGGASWLSWLSPIGWCQQVRSYAGERFWVLAFPVAFALLVVGAGYLLAARRDLGAGLVAAGSGPASAAARLRSPMALAWRLQRGALLGWAVGFAVVGVVVGSIGNGIKGLIGDNATVSDVLTRLGGRGGVIDAYLSTVLGMLGLVAAVYAVQAVLRLRSEETGLRAEPLLATRVGRIGWAVSHVAFAVLGSAGLLAVAGLLAGVTYGAEAGDLGGQLPRVLGAALVQVPAVWVLAGIAVAVFGLIPRLSVGGAWTVLGLSILIGEFGPLLRLNHWAVDVSPFAHVPRVLGATPEVQPLIWLLAIAALAGVLGLVGLRRRDIG